MAELTSFDSEGWSPANPFNVTKATDLTDEEIKSMWVDLGAEGGYRKIIDPEISMPRILLGGKGTGRTHLMRYLAASLQRLRSDDEPYTAPLAEGYLGIYLRCTGLNAGRFFGKGIRDDAWEAVFTYSMDLWLARLALTTALDTFGRLGEFRQAEHAVAADVVDAFDTYDAATPTTVIDLVQSLAALQRELDLAVNNAALTRSLEGVEIRIGRGRLPFLIPQIFAARVEALRPLNWLYLMDELENLTESQQRYVQTLIREREEPASFIVGTRTYGLRTRKTLSADEENKEGSEYAAVHLDHLYLKNHTRFGRFCRDIAAKRLAETGYSHIVGKELDKYFQGPERTRTRDSEVSFVGERGGEPTYIVTLREKLMRNENLTDSERDSIVAAIRVEHHPVIERLNVLLLYKAWGSKLGLVARAEQLRKESGSFIAETRCKQYQDAMKHYGDDVVAKLAQEYDRRLRYTGVETFIRMAGGLPRNLLIILKNIVRAAEFNGETPFRDGAPVSEKSQMAGVLRAADWFYRDAKAMGEAGVAAERAVDRVATLMRALRFADRPPEAGISSFSLNWQALDEQGRRTLETARDWSLLLEIEGGQRDKNTRAVRVKFQLNPMVAPRWDLPLTRKGTLNLTPVEAKAIFSTESEADFEEIRKVRVARASVTAEGGKASKRQESLLDDGP